MIDEQSLLELIKIWECEWLDFKEKHHENLAKFVHDIICLANADHQGDRYLIFGVNDFRSITDVSADAKRRTQANIIDTLKNARFNHVPTLSMQELITASGSVIDILCIRNRPEKPYFLLQDYTKNGTAVRAGVPYTRVGDTNTPINSCPDDIKVERMYRQRFGLDLTPAERLKVYLRDQQNWKYLENPSPQYHYKPFPEFQIVEQAGPDLEDLEYQEPWISQFPDNRHAYQHKYIAKYHDTILDAVFLVFCDGSRYVTSVPKIWMKHESQTYFYTYYFVDGSTEYLTKQMVHTMTNINIRSHVAEKFEVFRSEEEAEQLIEKDFAAGMRRYIYYNYDENKRQYSQIERGISSAIRWRPVS